MQTEWERTVVARRRLLASLGASTLALAVAGGATSPHSALSTQHSVLPGPQRTGVGFQHLTAAEVELLEAWGDVLVPGAREAGIAHYVDAQLSRAEPLLILKYLDYTGPYLAFYQQGLQALERFSRAQSGQGFTRATPATATTIVQALAQNTPADWQGPPAPLFYFVTRNDAVDVTYGTPAGFDRLHVPYMAHIRPPQPW
jgi:hypothetical protein